MEQIHMWGFKVPTIAVSTNIYAWKISLDLKQAGGHEQKLTDNKQIQPKSEHTDSGIAEDPD